MCFTFSLDELKLMPTDLVVVFRDCAVESTPQVGCPSPKSPSTVWDLLSLVLLAEH